MVVIEEAVEVSEVVQVSAEVIAVAEASAEVDPAVAPHVADFEVSFTKIEKNDDLF